MDWNIKKNSQSIFFAETRNSDSYCEIIHHFKGELSEDKLIMFGFNTTAWLCIQPGNPWSYCKRFLQMESFLGLVATSFSGIKPIGFLLLGLCKKCVLRKSQRLHNQECSTHKNSESSRTRGYMCRNMSKCSWWSFPTTTVRNNWCYVMLYH